MEMLIAGESSPDVIFAPITKMIFQVLAVVRMCEYGGPTAIMNTNSYHRSLIDVKIHTDDIGVARAVAQAVLGVLEAACYGR